jgi:glutathione synthase/RimK-type ligase-like ATP-grasp enzyme
VKILGVYREKIYSNRAVDADRLVMEASVEALRLATGGTSVLMEPEEFIAAPADADVILSMAQNERALSVLENCSRKGTPVINSVASIRNCYRMQLSQTLENAGVNYPAYVIVGTGRDLTSFSLSSKNGYWVKRGDFHALSDSDVVYVKDMDDLQSAIRSFRNAGVERVIIQEHIPGPVFKFYGIGGKFFTYRQIKQICPSVQDELFPEGAVDVSEMKRIARLAAGELGLGIYGGDCIIDAEGGIHVIDMNDWPSFRTCRSEAAVSVAAHALSLMGSRSSLQSGEDQKTWHQSDRV